MKQTGRLVLVLDGQGGGMGAQLVRLLADKLPGDCRLLAVGTNVLATSAMLKAGAPQGATGENVVLFQAPRARVILGLWCAGAAVAMVLLDPWTGSSALAGAALVSLYYVTMSRRQFGGITGDLAGFFLQLCELGMVLAAVIGQKIEVLI